MDGRTRKGSSPGRSRSRGGGAQRDVAPGGSREERKRQTRERLLDAAMTLLEDQAFSSLGIREITREAGVAPSAFYRHFDSVEELGLVLVEDAFRTLRQMLTAARTDMANWKSVISGSVDTLVRHVQANRPQFRLIARERFSGNAVLRHVIRREIELFASELATDLARLPHLNAWSTEDLQMVASLMVGTVASTAEDLLDASPDDAQAEAEIRRRAEKQLRLISLGVPSWRSARG
ncbi:MAG TPA: TetR family transcriptional regulator [Baekduia sp.]|nr:TetR family transcriptional regulator [Baekduia sp.]